MSNYYYKPHRDSDDDFMEVVKDGEAVNTYYGIEAFKLRKSDIEALLQGKFLYHDINDGEYAMYIYYEEQE